MVVQCVAHVIPSINRNVKAKERIEALCSRNSIEPKQIKVNPIVPMLYPIKFLALHFSTCLPTINDVKIDPTEYIEKISPIHRPLMPFRSNSGGRNGAQRPYAVTETVFVNRTHRTIVGIVNIFWFSELSKLSF